MERSRGVSEKPGWRETWESGEWRRRGDQRRVACLDECGSSAEAVWLQPAVHTADQEVRDR